MSAADMSEEEWEESLLYKPVIPRFAVIPSKPQTPERLDLLDRCLLAITPQVDHVLLIDNTEDGSIPDPTTDLVPDAFHNVLTFRNPISPVNLSQLWNDGLRYAWTLARELDATKWDVAILNDDAIVPPGWFDAVSTEMRARGCAAGCSGSQQLIVQTEAKPVPLHTRMTGWAFILAGEKGIRANEQLLWWAGDDDIDWKARGLGGMVMIPGLHVQHDTANSQMTPELHAQSGRDMAAFAAYWGMRPW